MPQLPMSRRTLLAAGLGLGATPLVASCTREGAEEPPAQPPAPDPDPPVRERAAASVQALIFAYDATASRHPDLAKELASLREEHAAHLAALGAPSTASPSTPAPTTTPAAVPRDPRRARAALVAAETRAAADRVRAAVAAASPDLARLLAAMGACEAAHATLLREGA